MRYIFVLSFLSAVGFLRHVSAQGIVGVDLCACQPAVYEITLNFTVSCDMANVQGPGILDTTCSVTGETTEVVTDFVPKAVSQIQFLELNANFQLLQQEARDGSFRTNDTVRYTSVLGVQNKFNESSLPAGFQVIMRGVNAIDQPLQMFWLILYSNDCGVFPLLKEGQMQGWSVFTDFASPPQFVCPLVDNIPGEVPATSPAPTDLPATTPTDTVSPTMTPTGLEYPTVMPSVEPTESNTNTSMPTEAPTLSNTTTMEPSASMYPTTAIDEEDTTPTAAPTTTLQPTTTGDCIDTVQSCPVGGHKEQSKNIFLHPQPPSSHHGGYPKPTPPHGDGDTDFEPEPPDMIPICLKSRFLFWTSYETKCVDRHALAKQQQENDQQRMFNMFQCDNYSCGCCDPRDEGASYPSFCGGQICANDPRRTFCKVGSGWGRGWGDRCDNYVAICTKHGKTICVDELDHWFLAKTPGEDYTCGCCEDDDAEFCSDFQI